MPKGPERIFATAPALILYDHVDDMPWEAIEDVTGAAFSESDRGEIFSCTWAYSAAISFAGGPKVAKVEDLRRRLAAAAIEARNLSDRYAPPKPFAPNEEDTTDLHGLLYRTADGFSLTCALREFGNAAEKLLEGLSEEPSTPVPTSRRDPNVEALENFVRHVFEGAEGVQARNKEVGSLERSRWGIPVGQKSVVFVQFVNATLKSDFTKDQVRQAVRNVVGEAHRS